MKFGTRAIHAGQNPDPSTGAIMTPIYQTSTYVQTSPGVLVDKYDYSRTNNPTRSALEANLAALEEGAYGICFSSGVAAIAAVVHLLKTGDHVILCDDVYGGTFRLFDKVFKQLGISYSLVDMTNQALVEEAFTAQTKLVWLETPTNPMLKILDIKAIDNAPHDSDFHAGQMGGAGANAFGHVLQIKKGAPTTGTGNKIRFRRAHPGSLQDIKT